MGIKVENLDHLGIVAGIIDKIGLVEIIDEHLGCHPQQKVTSGQAVKAMVINGLGFVSAPLYLYGDFFQGKATEHLLGNNITAEMLNDDLLGRTLERLFQCGIGRLFSLIAMSAYEKFALEPKSYHLDATSISVQGDYESQNQKTEDAEAQEDPKAVSITYGYSRDHRPDLKQFMVDMICSGDGGVPLAINLGNGNQSDQKVFAQRIVAFRQQWDLEGLFVADAALYSEENLERLGNLRWLTRVAMTIKSAKEAVREIPTSAFHHCEPEGYRYATLCSNYGGVKQRWMVFESEKSRASDLKALEKRIKKAETQVSRQVKQFAKQGFSCADDARKQGEQLDKSWRYHRVQSLEVESKTHYGRRGRPKPGDVPQGVTYHVQVTVVVDEEAVAQAQRQAGRFILSTNVLDEQELSAEVLLHHYKQQQYSERGWRFLKDPLFFSSSVFLKTPGRIMALAMVMGLGLMVYSLAERQLRQALVATGQTVPNQKKKQTQKPTLRWMFQCFQSLHVLYFEGRILISNLTDLHLQVLALLGPPCQKYYCLP